MQNNNPIEKVREILGHSFSLGSSVSVTIKSIIIILIVFILTYLFLKLVRKIAYKTLSKEAQYTFKSIFSFFNYFIYLIVILITFDNIGVNVTAIFAASAALLVGVGLALQTFIQDIISGVFIIADQTLHIGDIIHFEGRIGKVEDIKLRTTRVITIDNKVLIIPNHKFLTSALYNWTQNGKDTRDFVEVSVAYGTDMELVKELLKKTALEHPKVLKREGTPAVLLDNFGDNGLNLRLLFILKNSFEVNFIKSDLRFKIYEAFNANGIEIPFPQRTVWLNNVEQE